jgi:glycosyltransferase involved in cell wall biosynthesis
MDVPEPLVSVIVIFLDAEAFIEEALESVLAQTYRRWEVVLVDDGSRDRSSEIARRYAASHADRIRYVEHDRHRNRGMSASRNAGIRESRGEYIAFLDADDVWFAEKLERQVAILAAQPDAAMVCGTSEYWYSWSPAATPGASDYVPDLGMESDVAVKPPRLLTLALQSRVRTPCPSDILVRRQIVDAVGGFEESFRAMYEDQAFLAKVYLRAPVFVTSQCWDRYRRHPNSCVSAAAVAGRKYSAGLIYLRWLGKYLRAEGITDPDLWDALRDKRRRYRRLAMSTMLTRSKVAVKQFTDRFAVNRAEQ